MSTEENKATIRSFYEAAGDPERALEFVSPDFVDHSLPVGVRQGREGFRRHVAMFKQAFPDLRVEVEHLVAEGDMVADRVVVRGTHQGELMGIPATGKQVVLTSTNINHLAGGQIVEHWGDADNLGLLQQLGVVPAPEQAGVAGA